MLHIILAGLCLLQFQETYSSYCHCCKPTNYAFCNPILQNTVQRNFFYKHPKETVAIFHQKPHPCFQPCEWKQYNFTAPLISGNPSVMPSGSSADDEGKSTPEGSTTMMMESKEKFPSMTPFSILPTEMEGSATLPSPTPIPPVSFGGSTEPPATMVPINTEGTQPTSPMMFTGPVGMEEGISPPTPIPSMEDGNTCINHYSQPINSINTEQKTSVPTPIPMIPMNNNGDGPTSSPSPMEEEPSNPNPLPMRMEGDNSAPRPFPMNPVSTDGLTLVLCPIFPDGNNLQFNPTPTIPSTEEGTPSPMEPMNMENENCKQKTPEEDSKLTPVGPEGGSAPSSLPMEGEIPQSVSMSIDPMAIKEGAQPNTMQVGVMMMEEGTDSPPMSTDPNPPEKETSQPKPYPTVPVGMDGGDPTPINKPIEMNVVSSQPLNIECGTHSTVLPTCASVAYDAPCLPPVIELCNTQLRHLPPVMSCKHKTILENQKSIPSCTAIDNSCYQCISNPTSSTIGPTLTHTETSIKYLKPVYEEIVHHVPVLKNVIKNRIVETTRHIPVVDKLLVEEQHKIIHHLPVVQKCRRDVVEFRAKHVPILKHRSRIIEEPCLGHITQMEHVARPVIETVIRKVPVVFSKKTPVIHHRIRHIPVTETRCHPVIEESVTTMPVRQRIMKNIVEQRIRTIIGPWTNFASHGLYTGAICGPSSLHPGCGNIYQSTH